MINGRVNSCGLKPLPLLAVLLLASSGGPKVAAEPARPLIGAIRWDAWHQVPAGDVYAPVLAMERSLGPKQYQHRLPFFATVVSDREVRVNGYTPAIIEQEIAFAKAGGLDYWAFLLYDTNSSMSQALALYLASPRQADVSFCAIAQFANFAKEPARLVGMMAKTNYVRVAGGRPLLYAFRISQEQIQILGGPEKARIVFDRLRADAMAAGCGNPYLVVMNDNVAGSASIAKAIGAEAISDYAVSGHGGKNGSPYSELTQAARNFWQQAADSGAQVVPLAMSGWDRRPRIEHPVPWEKYQQPGVGMERYFQSPTPLELAAHIGDAMTWVDAHPQQCPARAVIIYAWNEHDEGGWLCPTRGADGSPDKSRIEALSAMLSNNWKK